MTRSPALQRRTATPAILPTALVLPALLLTGLLPLLGCRGPERQDAPARDSPSPDLAAPALDEGESRGEAIYRRENCARCHTQRDVPRSSDPAHLPGPPDLGLLGSRVGPDLGIEGHRRSDDWHFAHLYAPEILVPGSRMPASRHLFTIEAGTPVPAAEARDLVAYLQALGRGRRDVWAEIRSREPLIPPRSRNPGGKEREAGERLYAAHCVPCHGTRGDGRGPAAGLLQTPPRDFTAERPRFRSGPAGAGTEDADMFRTITLGTGTGSAMPAFYFLTAEERWSLVDYVAQFGAGLGRRAEGASGSAGPAAAGPAGGGSADRGRAAWESLGCGSCHGENGRKLGDLTHACARKAGGSDAAFARALLYGVGDTMPSFADSLDDAGAAARDLLAFLEGLPKTGAPVVSEPAAATSPRTRSRP